jgi:hypothetical protein
VCPGWLRRFCTIDFVIHMCLRLSPGHMRAGLPAERQTRSIASQYRYAYHKLSSLPANPHAGTFSIRPFEVSRWRGVSDTTSYGF